jgi:gamma-glutamylcyclotransferase (GGCT)/AIG2-like uncharacterized protein YtfP
MNVLVFVYGSLKRGCENRDLLATSNYLGATQTKEKSFLMISLGRFPAVFNTGEDGNYAIQGELYEVDGHTLFLLDKLEGNGEFYERIPVLLESGHTAWMYCLHPDLVLDEDYIEEDRRVFTENQVQTWLLPPSKNMSE